jgi:hypothetical protein
MTAPKGLAALPDFSFNELPSWLMGTLYSNTFTAPYKDSRSRSGASWSHFLGQAIRESQRVSSRLSAAMDRPGFLGSGLAFRGSSPKWYPREIYKIARAC